MRIELLRDRSARAQDTLLWRTVGQWQIRVDKSLGYGCFLVGSYTQGTILRIGIDQQNGNGYVMVGNEVVALASGRQPVRPRVALRQRVAVAG